MSAKNAQVPDGDSQQRGGRLLDGRAVRRRRLLVHRHPLGRDAGDSADVHFRGVLLRGRHACATIAGDTRSAAARYSAGCAAICE